LLNLCELRIEALALLNSKTDFSVERGAPVPSSIVSST
jgi:hypothetical protein